MRDFAPKSAIGTLEVKAQVIPVPLEGHWFRQPANRTGPCRILWNHRWEYDKAPERFFAAIHALHTAGLSFELYIVGQSFQDKPKSFIEAKDSLSKHIRQWGYLDSTTEYQALLPQMDLVISTALHEFQGLSVLEAAASGCHVRVPNRLAYPEWFQSESLYESHEDDALAEQEALTDALCSTIEEIEQWRKRPAPALTALSWDSLKSKYQALLERTA